MHLQDYIVYIYIYILKFCTFCILSFCKGTGKGKIVYSFHHVHDIRNKLKAILNSTHPVLFLTQLPVYDHICDVAGRSKSRLSKAPFPPGMVLVRAFREHEFLLFDLRPHSVKPPLRVSIRSSQRAGSSKIEAK